jgi:hypothetical protein
VSRYRSSDISGTATACAVALAAILTVGCTTWPPASEQSDPAATDESVARHLEFMKLAAEADDEARKRMKRDIVRRSRGATVTTRLRLGFLLTSPQETADARVGERMLRELLSEGSGLTPDLKNLIELRLLELDARRALRVELAEAKGKIDDLLSIESEMETKKNESRGRTH